MQDIIFENTPKEQHQTLLTLLSFGMKLATAGLGLAFSAILLDYPLVVVIAIMFAISLSEILLSIKLNREIVYGRAKKVSLNETIS